MPITQGASADPHGTTYNNSSLAVCLHLHSATLRRTEWQMAFAA